MNKPGTYSLSRVNDITMYLFVSVVVTLFLFFIDEGYYSFYWMKSLGNWFVFFIYVTGLLSGQLIVSTWIFKRHPRKRMLSMIFGIPLGVLFMFILFYKSIGH